jgi:hypothetical protein|tara:strand:+ start:625 stop:786 length:162 start_codon:yes stop_codon:yes gene_type:complete
MALARLRTASAVEVKHAIDQLLYVLRDAVVVLDTPDLGCVAIKLLWLLVETLD